MSKALDPETLAEMDAQIEAEFQACVRATKAKSRRRREGRHIGCPIAFFNAACRSAAGRNDLALALLIWRRTAITGHKTVTLPTAELADAGIAFRGNKRRALARLQRAGLIEVEASRGRGHTTRITLLWRQD